MKKVDINVDIGEGFPFDEDLLDFATSANVCCGEHAGSWELTKDTIFLCERKGVRIGMHPGFPDRESMGRELPEADAIAQYANSIFEQVIRFREYTDAARYMKPHGAWYNVLCRFQILESRFQIGADGAIYQGCKLMLDGALAAAHVPVMLLAGCPLAESSKPGVIEEGFADRGYASSGALLPRSAPGAVLSDREELQRQVLRLAPVVDSICIHGDTPGCVEFAELVYGTLETAGYEVGF